jgi:hypothetical protein
MEHGSAYIRNPQWFGATFATRSGLARAPIIESAGEPIVRATSERVERATVVALDPIVFRFLSNEGKRRRKYMHFVARVGQKSTR